MKLALVPRRARGRARRRLRRQRSSSSSSSPSPKDWADNLCSAITTWSTSVKTAGRVAQERQPLEGRPEEDDQRDQVRHQHLRRRPEGPRQAEHRRRSAGEGRDRSALDRDQRRRRQAAERGRRGGRVGHEGRRQRRLEHRHHALDDEHADRARPPRSSSRQTRRASSSRASRTPRPARSSAAASSGGAGSPSAHARDEHGDHRHEVQLAEQRLDDRERAAELVRRACSRRTPASPA